MSGNGQQLFPISAGARLADGLAARTKDGFWMLAQQYLAGEFVAEPVGTPTQVTIAVREYPLTSVTRDHQTLEVDTAVPLDCLVEAETAAGDSPGWRTDALEYQFEAATTGHALKAGDYHGRGLDWYHFDYVGGHGDLPTPVEHSYVPSALQFAGAPHPRWWSFESGDAYFDSPIDPQPNVLSMLLPEFFLIDLDNWFVIPLTQKAGTMREIVSLTVTDGFGFKTVLPAIASLPGKSGWNVFALSDKSPNAAAGAATAGNLLFVPNVAKNVLDNEDLEAVTFVRDEDANLVWAVEQLYFDKALGRPVRRGDPAPDPAGGPDHKGSAASLRYMFRTPTPQHWIPYVPRLLASDNLGLNGDFYLRRGRTVEDASVVQHRGEILAKSWRLDDHEIPPTTISVKRQRRSATGSNGQRYHWVGRWKAAAPRMATPGLNFDYLAQD